jgi:nucleoside-diphosphate-sugar epimerase
MGRSTRTPHAAAVRYSDGMTNSPKTALIVGCSGIVGSALVRHLVAQEWHVLGLARHPLPLPGVTPLAADLGDPASLTAALQGISPSHVFLCTWSRQPSEAQNILVNAAHVRNLLDALRQTQSTRHVALVTGLKHYLGPFDSYAKGVLPQTPFREDQPRLDVPNFYYAQEDEVFAAAARDGFTWSVHRPHTVIGTAVGNAMNMGSTLAVYASLCRETGRHFYFPGSPTQWHGLTDMTDARLLARHLAWASITPGAADQAFNVVNGDVFRWNWMWRRIADWFGLQAQPFDAGVHPLAEQMAADAPVWEDLARRHGLRESRLDHVSSPWHTDADLGRPIEVVTDMSKSRAMGFLDYQATDQAFFDLFAKLREERIIPPAPQPAASPFPSHTGVIP